LFQYTQIFGKPTKKRNKCLRRRTKTANNRKWRQTLG